MGHTGLYWDTLGHAGLHWATLAALGYARLHWAPLGCTGPHWAALGPAAGGAAKLRMTTGDHTVPFSLFIIQGTGPYLEYQAQPGWPFPLPSTWWSPEAQHQPGSSLLLEMVVENVNVELKHPYPNEEPGVKGDVTCWRESQPAGA